jgi:hypothetical protein
MFDSAPAIALSGERQCRDDAVELAAWRDGQLALAEIVHQIRTNPQTVGEGCNRLDLSAGRA